jgi:uncharacterized protein (DUF4213/DUF364 family)
MEDILKTLFSENSFKSEAIETIAIGDKYVGIMLTNGNIGVAAKLKEGVLDNPIRILDNPDFNNYSHRILVNAWINARSNYNITISGEGDIFEALDFSAYKNIVMIGFFSSLVGKFKEKDLNLSVFDLNEYEVPVEPITKQKEYVQNADCIILTATSLANLTYKDLLSYSSEACSILMLGPSSPLSHILAKKLGLSIVFGAQFEPFDYQVISLIRSGGGTRSFLHLMKKVYIKSIL